MEIIYYINSNLSGVLSVLVSAITALITLIYVVFTYKQLKATQNSVKLASEQMRLNNQPCISAKIGTTYGSPCFPESDRRQLHIDIKLENIGDSPALEIYTFSYLELTSTVNKYDGSNIVNMYYYPDYIKYIKPNSKQFASVRYEEEEINMILDDLWYNMLKNHHRIHTDPSKPPFNGPLLIIEVFYKNLLGQWFKSTLKQPILCLVDESISKEEPPHISGAEIPPSPLTKNTEFSLLLKSPRLSMSEGVKLVDQKEIWEKIKSYQELNIDYLHLE